MPTTYAYVVGTCDTKFAELLFVKERILAAGIPVKLVDVGILPHQHSVDIPNHEVSRYYGPRPDFLASHEGRGDAVSCMSEAFVNFVNAQSDIGGIISLGGSGGTVLATPAMQALPIGLPKVMVSTIASGNMAPFVGASDICMMYSVTDVAGIHQISNTILSNGAHALVGMMKNAPPPFVVQKPALGMSMFGVTTPCITQIRAELEKDYECLVFHATGTGGRSLEKLIDSGMLKYVLDLTTTEICDLLMGGILSAGEDRMGSVIRQQIPYIGSVGALDMVNFGHIDTVPEKYKDRLFYKHNPQVTLMRTTAEENIQIGKWIAAKLNQMQAPVRFFLSEKGVSMIAVEGQPFYDPKADQALFDTLKAEVKQTENRKLISLPYDINAPEFSTSVIEAFRELVNL